jgi:hypothetical protein
MSGGVFCDLCCQWKISAAVHPLPHGREATICDDCTRYLDRQSFHAALAEVEARIKSKELIDGTELSDQKTIVITVE